MTLEVAVGDRLYDAAQRWAERRMTDPEDALETKAEQALLEVEHLVSGAHEVEFEVEGRRIRYEPTDDLAEFLERQAEETDLDPSDVLELHVDLFADAFRSEQRPANAPRE